MYNEPLGATARMHCSVRSPKLASHPMRIEWFRTISKTSGNNAASGRMHPNASLMIGARQYQSKVACSPLTHQSTGNTPVTIRPECG